VRQAERDAGQRACLTTDERQRLKELERENRELKRANEILKKASAYFAQAARLRSSTPASTRSRNNAESASSFRSYSVPLNCFP
jgi:transposase-like protein